MAVLHTGPLRTKYCEAVGALVERVCASAEFDKSPRSQELLRYLCERVKQVPETHVTEHEIGVALFGWDRNFHPEADTIVRVQISQLRKRLTRYFLDSGREEPIQIVIPRGSYAPVVQPRCQPAIEPSPVPEAESASATKRQFHWKTAASSAVVTAAIVLGAMWVSTYMGRRVTASPARTATPALDHFWAGFRNGSPAMVVLPDVSQRLLSEIVGYTIPLELYKDGYPNDVLETVKQPRERLIASRIADNQITGMHDATTLAGLAVLFSGYHVPYTPILARDFRLPQSDNLVLMGHLKGNPWLELYQKRLNFGYEYDWKTRLGSIVNRAPRAGEQARYTVSYSRVGYCVVACLPRSGEQGESVVIFGSDVASLEAGGRFVTSEKALEEFYRQVGKSADLVPRHIEVLLRTALMGNLVPENSVLSYRVYPQ